MTIHVEDPEAIPRLWADYKATGNPSARDGLIVHYSPLVKYVAGRVASGLPSTVDQGDLVSSGIFGLIDAINKFDLSRAVKFEAYAMTRIRGAIIDELRSIDWVPRSVRAKAKLVESAYASLEHRLGRTPSEAEIAVEIGVSKEEVQHLFSQVAFVGLVALDAVMRGGDGQSQTLGDTLADQGDGPMAAFESAETKQILAKAISSLGDREKSVLSLYYYEGLTLAEIGKILGVTESRVCQIHSRAVLQLRSRMDVADRGPAS